MTLPGENGDAVADVTGIVAGKAWYNRCGSDFAGLPYAVLDRLKHVSGAAVKMYLALSGRANNATGVSWPSIRKLVEDTGLGSAAAVRGLRELKAAGLIDLQERAGEKGRGGTSNQYRNRSASEIEALPFCAESVSLLAPKAFPKAKRNYSKELKSKNETHRRTPRFDPADRETAAWMFSLIRQLDDKAHEPNLDTWANSIRLMRTAEGRIDAEIRDVFAWANTDDFWRSNILSPGKLREQFTTLKTKSKGNHHGNGKPSRHNDGGASDPGTKVRSLA
jgi:hypothetical protein